MRGDRPAMLRLLVAIAALGAVATFVVVALGRVRYPYELEWMEGGVLDHVRRAAAGQSLYARPSLRFTSYLYTPLYYYVGAAVGAVFGTTVTMLRVVSLVSALAATALVGGLVHHETQDRWASLVGAGLFLACFRIAGAWLDLARVDSLFLALTLAGVWLARVARRERTLVVAGVAMAAAIETKQQAVLVAIAVFVALLASDRRRALVYGATVAGVAGAASIVLEITSDGWFHVYAVELLLHHTVVEPELVQFWTRDLWWPLPIALVLAAALLATPRILGRDAWRFHGLVTVAMILVAYSSRLHSGGYDNVLLPAYAAVAVLVGLAVHHFGRRGPSVTTAVAGVVLVAVLVQFAILVYDPAEQPPSPAAVREGDALVADLRALPAPVAVFGHGWYAEQAGHATLAQCAAVTDVVRARIPGVSDRLAATLERAFADQRFTAVVVDSQRSLSCVPADLGRYYRPVARLPGPWPLTGTRTRPLTVWLPRWKDALMIAAFSITPLGVGESVSASVADAVRIVRESGLPNETNAMFTNVEGEWDEVMSVLKACVDAVAAKAPRVSVVVKIDHRAGVTDGLRSKVAAIEARLEPRDDPS